MGDTLVSVTYGRGMFRIDLSNVPDGTEECRGSPLISPARSAHPLVIDPALFADAGELGCRVIWMHCRNAADLRLVGLGLVITRDGGIPLVAHAYPGNRPARTQFATMIDLLVARHTALAAAARSADPAATSLPLRRRRAHRS